MIRADSVDDYIANTPVDVQVKLRKLRSVIKKTALKAEERISYGIPYYSYYGRLAYFSAFKKHIGLYIPPPVVEDHKKELEGYVTKTSTIRFPLDKKLPINLIKKLIKARMEKIEKNKPKLY